MKGWINRKGWILGLTVALVLAACGPGDLPETSVENITENVTENKMESTAENAILDTTEDTTEAATEELTSAVEPSSSEEETLLATEEDTQDWGEPSQVLSGDWNEDGQEDILKSYWEDSEGGTYGIGVRLQISGTKEPGVVLSHGIGVLEEVLNADLDGDGQQEIVLIFDRRGNGANGAYGLMLLDHIDDEWIAVTEDKLFSGFTYQVNYEEATSSYLVQGAESGKEHHLLWDKELEDPAYTSGRATLFYNWTVVSGTDQDYLELWQYIAGEFTTDHVGDMVTTIALQDGAIQLKDEIAVQESLMQGDVMALLSEDTRYYHRFDENHMIRVNKEEMPFTDEDISKSDRYRVFLDGDQVVCIMWDPRQ